MRITSGGLVGIGTSSPTTKLDVLSVGADAINIGAGNDFSGLRLTSDAGTWAIRTSIADALFFYDVSSSAERMRITSTGLVGIGTTAPINGGSDAKWLTVDGNSYGGGFISSVAGVAKGYVYYDNSTTSLAIQGAASTGITLLTTNIERARITTGGNFLIGTTTDSGYKLNVNGTTYINSNFTVNGTITELSSAKLKTDIKSIDSSLDKVKMLRPVTYKKIGGEKTEIGLIAEEVEKIYPELVEYTSAGEVLGLNYSRLTAVLIESVKELKQEINELKLKN
jgi:hypothetical protein